MDRQINRHIDILKYILYMTMTMTIDDEDDIWRIGEESSGVAKQLFLEKMRSAASHKPPGRHGLVCSFYAISAAYGTNLVPTITI